MSGRQQQQKKAAAAQPLLITYVRTQRDFKKYQRRLAEVLRRSKELMKKYRDVPRPRVPAADIREFAALQREVYDAFFMAAGMNEIGFVDFTLKADDGEPYVLATRYLRDVRANRKCDALVRASTKAEVAACEAVDKMLSTYIARRDARGSQKVVHTYGVLPEGGDVAYGVLPPLRKAPYGDVPGEAQPVHELLSESRRARRRHVVKSAQLARVFDAQRPSRGPLRVMSLNVEHGRVVLATVHAVDAAIRATERLTKVRQSKVVAHDGLFVVKHGGVDAGTLLAEYDGALVSFARAEQLIDSGRGAHVRTLRAGLWAIDGYANAERIPRGAGLGSFAADNLDVCESIVRGREVRCQSTALNAQLIVLTDADNAAAADDTFDANRAHLVLLSTRPIGADEQIFYSYLQFADFV